MRGATAACGPRLVSVPPSNGGKDARLVVRQAAHCSGWSGSFFHHHYGQQWIELRRGWIFKRKTRVRLPLMGLRELKTRFARAVRGGLDA
jgi:hypothetical protein